MIFKKAGKLNPRRIRCLQSYAPSLKRSSDYRRKNAEAIKIRDGLGVTIAQAREIIKDLDRKKAGRMGVCHGPDKAQHSYSAP